MLRIDTVYVVSGFTRGTNIVDVSDQFEAICVKPATIPLRDYCNRMKGGVGFETVSAHYVPKPMSLATHRGVVTIKVIEREKMYEALRGIGYEVGYYLSFDVVEAVDGIALTVTAGNEKGNKMISLSPFFSLNTGYDAALYDSEIQWHQKSAMTSLENLEAVDL